MKKIYFTEDIREDILLGGLTISEFFQIICIMAISFFFLVIFPFPFLFKFLFFGIPALLLCAAIFLGIPQVLKRNRRFWKEPGAYQGKKLDSFFPVETEAAPCFQLKSGETVLFLEASMTGWEHLPPDEQEAIVWSCFQVMISNLTMEKVGIMVFVEDDKHLPTEEWSRQQAELDKGAVSSGLEEIGRARLLLHQAGATQGESRKVSYLIRISLDYTLDENEQEEPTRDRLIRLAKQTMADLSVGSISSMILSDVSTILLRQYVPIVWRDEKLQKGVQEFFIQQPAHTKKEQEEDKAVQSVPSFWARWVQKVKEKCTKFWTHRKDEKEDSISPILADEKLLHQSFSILDDLEKKEDVMSEVFFITPVDEPGLEFSTPNLQGSEVKPNLTEPKKTPIFSTGGLFVFVSRFPTGKTFLALNTAAIAAKQQPTALIDFDIPNRALHTWANLPEEEQGLLTLFQPEGGMGYCPPYASHLEIFGLDPEVDLTKITVDMMNSFWENLDQLTQTKKVVVDLPLDHPSAQKLCEKADAVYAVFDSNYHHFRKWRKDWAFLQGFCNPIMLWNQREEGLDLPFTEEFGCYPVISLPRLEGVQHSIFTGRPYVLLPGSEKHHFEQIELEEKAGRRNLM